MKNTPPDSRRGLLSGGNWTIDRIKVIDVYPQPEHLANIRSESQGLGGAPANVLTSLAQSGAPFPLFAAGLVGRDASGRAIFHHCRRLHIDTSCLSVTAKAPTSSTDVMTEAARGRRTFFHARGANALWRGQRLDFRKINARIFHLGYLLLLDSLDQPDPAFGTRAARLLANAQTAGLRTSVDVVSEDSARFARLVSPALPYTDYCIINEIEAGKTAGIELRRPDGRLASAALRPAAAALLRQGVRELIVIHFPEGAYARTRQGNEAWQPSLKLPAAYIRGTVGAGDAFCAGVLLGLHEGWALRRCLRAGVCIAAASLSAPTGTAGVKSLARSLALGRRFGFRSPLSSKR